MDAGLTIPFQDMLGMTLLSELPNLPPLGLMSGQVKRGKPLVFERGAGFLNPPKQPKEIPQIVLGNFSSLGWMDVDNGLEVVGT